ncbi:MAG: thiol peroxidase [Candidatus Omnitrophica bacterium]|jgi:thiol peroxidase|nr:thiol peroxidase [Candidatus Omnitrophota bacterium]
MPRIVTFKGKELTLVGNDIKIGEKAPEFSVVSQDLSDVSLEKFKNKIKVISTFPSLDTPVCDLQVKAFNKKASELSEDIVVIGISKDLPFAQKRFCDTNSIKQSIVLSDYKNSSFGMNYGVLINELNLLARAVFIIDKNNVLKYEQVSKEITQALNYDEAFLRLNKISEEDNKNS